MKKFAKLAALFVALVLALSCIVACSNAGDAGSSSAGTDTESPGEGQNSSGNGGSGSAGTDTGSFGGGQNSSGDGGSSSAGTDTKSPGEEQKPTDDSVLADLWITENQFGYYITSDKFYDAGCCQGKYYYDENEISYSVSGNKIIRKGNDGKDWSDTADFTVEGNKLTLSWLDDDYKEILQKVNEIPIKLSSDDFESLFDFDEEQ